jgi:carboxymethylenebutenolidase
MGRYISIKMGNDKEMRCYLASPKGDEGPGIVLAMSIYGVNSELRAAAEYFCALGYVVLAPNLFWAMDPDHGVEFSDAGQRRAGELLQRFDDQHGVESLGVAARSLRQRPECHGGVAAVGWCMGGRLAYLSAAAQSFDAAAAFYPTWLETRLDLADSITCPLSLHLPESEPYAKEEDALQSIERRFCDRENVELFVYPGATHGFDFSPPEPYHRWASQLANSRVALLLKRTIGAEAAARLIRHSRESGNPGVRD